jgi:hypothetical protein
MTCGNRMYTRYKVRSTVYDTLGEADAGIKTGICRWRAVIAVGAIKWCPGRRRRCGCGRGRIGLPASCLNWLFGESGC